MIYLHLTSSIFGFSEDRTIFRSLSTVISSFVSISFLLTSSLILETFASNSALIMSEEDMLFVMDSYFWNKFVEKRGFETCERWSDFVVIANNLFNDLYILYMESQEDSIPRFKTERTPNFSELKMLRERRIDKSYFFKTGNDDDDILSHDRIESEEEEEGSTGLVGLLAEHNDIPVHFQKKKKDEEDLSTYTLGEIFDKYIKIYQTNDVTPLSSDEMMFFDKSKPYHFICIEIAKSIGFTDCRTVIKTDKGVILNKCTYNERVLSVYNSLYSYHNLLEKALVYIKKKDIKIALKALAENHAKMVTSKTVLDGNPDYINKKGPEGPKTIAQRTGTEIAGSQVVFQSNPVGAINIQISRDLVRGALAKLRRLIKKYERDK
jgi:hypothetical protein